MLEHLKELSADAEHERLFLETKYPSASTCAVCHVKQFGEWSVSDDMARSRVKMLETATVAYYDAIDAAVVASQAAQPVGAPSSAPPVTSPVPAKPPLE